MQKKLRVLKMEEDKKILFNPYAKALEGLHLDDPVKAFFDFCKERESIRIRCAR